MEKQLNKLLLLVCASVLLWGCNPVTVHKVTTTIFDGVPRMPDAVEYCQDYHDNKIYEESEAARQKQKSLTKESKSVHPPYAEKRCDDCHDKSKTDGLIKPAKELCFICHPDIISKQFVHGPAAVGNCLECHEAHSAGNPSLLKLSKEAVCVRCHKEKRAAEGLHAKVAENNLSCADCHDPHAGSAKYFLK